MTHKFNERPAKFNTDPSECTAYLTLHNHNNISVCDSICRRFSLIAASVHSAATPLGSLVSGLLMDRCGRKLALQIASIPLIVGWTLIGFSANHGTLLLGRLIAGVSAGLTAAAGQVRISLRISTWNRIRSFIQNKQQFPSCLGLNWGNFRATSARNVHECSVCELLLRNSTGLRARDGAALEIRRL